jgi:cytidine deaminase
MIAKNITKAKQSKSQKSVLGKRKFSEALTSPSITTDGSSAASEKALEMSEKRLKKDLAPLIKAAWKARDNAYCPYSGFKVGAAMRSKATGKIYHGCNVENAAFPSGICAERGALCNALATEGPGIEFDEIVVVTNADEPSAPCGSCRQMMVEFGTEAVVNSINAKGDKTRMTMDELLPNSFGPKSFKQKPISKK